MKNPRLSRACAWMLALALSTFLPMGVASTPLYAFAEEAATVEIEVEAQAEAEAQTFAYTHSPLYNPKAMADVVENPQAVYGFSPNPDAGSLKEYAAYDWTDPDFVAQARENRATYLHEDQLIYDLVKQMEEEGADAESIARAASARRNQIRLDSYKDNPEGLARVEARNLEKYGHEEGPTPEWLYEKYGSWELVVLNAFNTNPGMDACCGFYDDNWEKYVHFGQIPVHTVSFDAADHGEAPEPQSVYAGEPATRPEDPTAEGWVFLGWHADGASEPFDFAAPIAADVMLTASWEQASAPAPDENVPGDDTPNQNADTPQDAEPTDSNAGSAPAAEDQAERQTEPAAKPHAAEPKPAATQTQAATSQQQPAATSASSAAKNTLPQTADPTSTALAAQGAVLGLGGLAAGTLTRRARTRRRAPLRVSDSYKRPADPNR